MYRWEGHQLADLPVQLLARVESLVALLMIWLGFGIVCILDTKIQPIGSIAHDLSSCFMKRRGQKNIMQFTATVFFRGGTAAFPKQAKLLPQSIEMLFF